jgi:hypothetical protein
MGAKYVQEHIFSCILAKDPTALLSGLKAGNNGNFARPFPFMVDPYQIRRTNKQKRRASTQTLPNRIGFVTFQFLHQLGSYTACSVRRQRHAHW